MDIVITYVDGNDPIWKADYEKYTNVPVMQKRFRDWGTLKYLLRGIEVYMPFIRNVYLVVSHQSQVPSWADRDNLKIVLHKLRIYLNENINYSSTPAQKEIDYKHCTVIAFFPTKQMELQIARHDLTSK